MTEKLKTLMDHAADRDFAPVDLAAIMDDADRTVRRRRLAALAGAAAALAVVGGTLAVLGGHGGEDRAPVTGRPSPVAPLGVVTWTWDGELHTPTASYPLGHQVATYVRTSVGYAFADPSGAVFSFVGGKVERIGAVVAEEIRLVADDEGSLVGWAEPGGGFVVQDLTTGVGSTFGEVGPDTDGAFLALDGRTAYVRDDRGLVAVDVDTQAVRVIDGRPGSRLTIGGVENGQIAFASDDGRLRIGPSRGETKPIDALGGSTATYSPDGHWISIEGDEPRVVEVATGKRAPIDIDGRVFGTGVEWLDDDTVVLIASRTEEGPAELLTCELPSGRCVQVVADLGSFDEMEGRIAFATGIPVG